MGGARSVHISTALRKCAAMKKKLLTILKEWILFTLYGVLIMTVIFPLFSLFLGLLYQLFPDYANAGKVFFTMKSILDFLGKGALMGFLLGSMVYMFTRIFSSQSMYKS